MIKVFFFFVFLLSSLVAECGGVGPFSNAGTKFAKEAFAQRPHPLIEMIFQEKMFAGRGGCGDGSVGRGFLIVIMIFLMIRRWVTSGSGRRRVGLIKRRSGRRRREFQEAVPQAGIETSAIERTFIRVLTAEGVGRYGRALSG